MKTFNTKHNQLTVSFAGSLTIRIGNSDIELNSLDNAAMEYVFNRLVDFSRTPETELTNCKLLTAGRFTDIGGSNNVDFEYPERIKSFAGVWDLTLERAKGKVTENSISVIAGMDIGKESRAYVVAGLKDIDGYRLVSEKPTIRQDKDGDAIGYSWIISPAMV